jgi:hypothetical protein
MKSGNIVKGARSPIARTAVWVVIGAGLIFFTNPDGNFPLHDDWQYAYPVKTLLENGQLEFQGIFAPNILLQIGWGYVFSLPFGGFSFPGCVILPYCWGSFPFSCCSGFAGALVFLFFMPV